MLNNLDRPKNRLENLTLQMKYLSPANQINQKRTYCMDLEGRLNNMINEKLNENSHRLAIYIEKLKGLSPLDKLRQGYAYVESDNHKVVNSIDNIKQGDIVNIYVKNGVIESTVNKTTEVEYGG
jgi:exodeoxyribonuclease VII large subunit